MHLLNFLIQTRDAFLDFLFPKSSKILELEALSTETLLNTLPPSEHTKDSNTSALFDYNHSLVKEIIWELKYSGNTRIARKLGEILYDSIREDLDDLELFKADGWRRNQLLLIPIPVSERHRFERGWNQIELLAEQVMLCDFEKIFKYKPRLLSKFRHTESQTKTSSRNERLKNLANSMRVLDSHAVAGQYVVVLDDVTTTGATFAEARRALMGAGARKVICIAVAH